MEHLLKLLSDGRFHSGEALGEALGMTRSAVWKKLKNLESLGLQLDSVRGKGYRLHPGLELLDREAIVSGLDPSIQDDVAVLTCLQTTSTMDMAHQLGGGHDKKKTFCLAEYQSHGRGRRGRTWSNPFGSTISLSLRWQVSEGMAPLEGLSLAVGLGVLQALEACGAQNLKLKWPNDVLVDTPDGLKKLSGILLEVHGDPTGDCEVIIGIGVNVSLSQTLLAGIGQPAIDMRRACGRSASRNQVVSALINTLCRTLDIYGDGGFSRFHCEWVRRDAFLGREVILDAAGRKQSGRSAGVNVHGALLLETASGTLVFNGGEVSLKASGSRSTE